jgi:hypothetical protein
MAKGWFETFFEKAGEVAQSAGQFFFVHKFVENNSVSEAVRKLAEEARTNEHFDEFVSHMQALERHNDDVGHKARQIRHRYFNAKNRTDELVELLNDAPSVARRQIAHFYRQLPRDEYEDLIVFLDLKARITRDNEIGKLAEYTEDMMRR